MCARGGRVAALQAPQPSAFRRAQSPSPPLLPPLSSPLLLCPSCAHTLISLPPRSPVVIRWADAESQSLNTQASPQQQQQQQQQQQLSYQQQALLNRACKPGSRKWQQQQQLLQELGQQQQQQWVGGAQDGKRLKKGIAGKKGVEGTAAFAAPMSFQVRGSQGPGLPDLCNADRHACDHAKPITTTGCTRAPWCAAPSRVHARHACAHPACLRACGHGAAHQAARLLTRLASPRARALAGAHAAGRAGRTVCGRAGAGRRAGVAAACAGVRRRLLG